MAKATKKPPKQAKQGKPKITDNNLSSTFDGPALHTNKIFMSNFAGGTRLTFMEQMGDQIPPTYRTAVFLSYPDAIELRDLLARQLQEVESHIDQAMSEAGKEPEKSDG